MTLERTNSLSPLRPLMKKTGSLDLVRSNEDLGSDCVENDFAPPTIEGIRNARPLAAVLPQDVMAHATLAATTVVAGVQDDRAAS